MKTGVRERYTVIDSIATGNPPLRRSQEHAVAFMQRITSMPEPIRSRLPAIYARSGIDFRYSCIEDYGREAEDFAFYPPSWSLEPPPSSRARNEKYRSAVVPLGEQVAREALQSAGVRPEQVTHVVAVSCTGFFAPGLDIELVKRLGLSPSTRRTFVGFMGCYAAFNALRVADAFCQSDPDARVLVVCAELCTLHFQVSKDLESAVINGIFSDGAAAAVLSSRSAQEAGGELAYMNGHALLEEDSMDHMTWDLGDTGFLMGLSSRVPAVLAKQLPTYLEQLLDPVGMALDEVGFWAIHPGGRAIVDQARDVLNLKESDVADSLEVLRLHGNMSSPTVLFVLQRILQRHRDARAHDQPGYENGVALAFGPGLTMEGALFQRVPS